MTLSLCIDNIHKKVWELPIPEFISSNQGHCDLSELGAICTKKVSAFLSEGTKYRSIARIRKTVKDQIANELKQIDKIVEKILSS